jgi:hypothetical protein
MPSNRKRTPQRDVARLVAQRGHREGWTPEQFIARQVCKLAEGVGELAACVDLPGQLGPITVSTGHLARWTFGQKDLWESEMLCPPHQLMGKLVDIQVVVFCLAEELNRLTGEDFDVTEHALVKVVAGAMQGKQR